MLVRWLFEIKENFWSIYNARQNWLVVYLISLQYLIVINDCKYNSANRSQWWTNVIYLLNFKIISVKKRNIIAHLYLTVYLDNWKLSLFQLLIYIILKIGIKEKNMYDETCFLFWSMIIILCFPRYIISANLIWD